MCTICCYIHSRFCKCIQSDAIWIFKYSIYRQAEQTGLIRCSQSLLKFNTSYLFHYPMDEKTPTVKYNTVKLNTVIVHMLTKIGCYVRQVFIYSSFVTQYAFTRHTT